MEERLQEALKFSNYRQTLNNQLDLLKVNTDSALTYSVNGGTFTINRELICFVDLLISKGFTGSVLLDNNNLPIEIEDLESFSEDILERYAEVLNDFHAEYEKIRKARSVQTILDLNV